MPRAKWASPQPPPPRRLHEQGHRVTLADCDTQQSSSEWISEAVPEIKAVRLDDSDEILNETSTLAGDADYVVADGPGSRTETSRTMLLRADLAIVPCKASMLEARALANATHVLRQAQDVRGTQETPIGLPKAIVILSMVGKNYRLTQDMKDAAAALQLPLASTAVTLRQQRQLDGTPPFYVQEILEEAPGAWLRSNGHL